MASPNVSRMSLSQPATNGTSDTDKNSTKPEVEQNSKSVDKKAAIEDDNTSVVQPREKVKRIDKLWDRNARRYRYSRTRERNNDPPGSYVLSLARIFNPQGRYNNEVEVIVRGKHLREALDAFYEKVESISFPNASPSTEGAAQIFHARTYLSKLLEEERLSKVPEQGKILELEAAEELISHHFGSSISQLQALGQDRITFRLLWTLFPPHTLVYFLDELNEPTVLRVLSTTYLTYQEIDYFKLNCDYIDSNGRDIGYVKPISRIIWDFPGMSNVESLVVFPLDRHRDAEELKSKLIRRGQTARALVGRKIQQYSGLALGDWDRKIEKYQKFSTDGRIMVDPVAMEQAVPNHKLNVRIEKRVQESDLTSDQFLLWNSKVLGFSFKGKNWGGFAINALTDVEWDNHAFDKLTLPQEKKDFIQDLILGQSSNSNNGFDDFIRGKGKSLIGLLSGPPGVGKTLTAESIAEFAEMPLYKLSSGELGQTSSSVQTRLTEILKLTETWNAVLLIDEADVFLSQRTDESLEKSAITSIFLKELEYYSGILLMTTNRLKSFDNAFQSRIHFHFEYQDLSLDTKAHIWRQFLDMMRKLDSPAVEVSDDEILQLAKVDLNARRIKNVLRISQLVAQRRGKAVSFEIIQHAVQFTNWNWEAPETVEVDLI